VKPTQSKPRRPKGRYCYFHFAFSSSASPYHGTQQPPPTERSPLSQLSLQSYEQFLRTQNSRTHEGVTCRFVQRGLHIPTGVSRDPRGPASIVPDVTGVAASSGVVADTNTPVISNPATTDKVLFIANRIP
jgi:hypothetical protein